MFRSLFFFVFALTLVGGLSFYEAPVASVEAATPSLNGVISVKSTYGFAQTVTRLKADIEAKGLMFFNEIDQAGLAAAAGIELAPSTLLVFGNPALGTLFITARAEAGLDWPVRLLVSQDESGQVWASYTDFAWIAQRHGIDNRQAEFTKASEVIASIVSAVQ